MKKYLLTGFSFFVVLFLSLFFRCYPVYFPQLNIQADKIVDQKLRQKIALEINKTYPGFQDVAKARLFDIEVAKYVKENKESIRQQKKQEYAKLKDRFQDKFGHTYLMELDGWHWGRYVQNIDRLGRVGDEVRDGKQHDNLMFFPAGNDINWSTLFYYTSWALYKLFTLFYPMPIFSFLFYLPLFYMGVLITLLYFFCYRYWGSLVAAVCCIFVATGPILIPRSCAGWFDFDTLSLIYPLLIVWSYILAYSAATWLRRVGWAVLAAFWLSLFCATWIGWAFILSIILFYEIIVLANCLSERLQYGQDTSGEIKRHLIVPAVFFFFGAFWIILISGITPLEGLVLQFKQAVSLNRTLTSVIWPNAFSTVGELKKGDYGSIARAIGGMYPLFLGLICVLGSFLNIKRYTGAKREFLMIFVVWFLTMFFLCSRGIRFAIFLLMPMGLFLGWGIAEANQFLLRKKWKLAVIPLVLMVVLLVVSLVSNADNTAKGTYPLMEDDWYSTLVTIKKYTPADAVVNSWWDYGDWFKAVAQRRVIFDGQTQNTPMSYWMARVLLTDSEKEAMGTLRMLNNGGNSAFETIDKHVCNPFLSIFLLKKAIMLEPQEGKALLSTYLSPAVRDQVADILYSRPKQKAYFIVDSSMIAKMYSISSLGNWDFYKVYLSKVIRFKSKAEILKDLVFYGLDQAQAEKYYQEASLVDDRDLAGWMSLKSTFSSISSGKSKDGQVLFNNGYIYNINQKTMYSYSSYEERYRTPQSIFLAKGGEITEVVLPSNDSKYSALVLENNDMYKIILLSRELAKSVFVRLQFLNGKGLSHFVPFSREVSETNSIFVYEVKWD